MQALVADGAAPALTLPAGWTGTRTLSGVTTIDGTSVSLRGGDQIPSGQSAFGSALADRLGLSQGAPIVIGGQAQVVTIEGGGQSVTVSTELARSLVGDNGWWTLFAPAGQQKNRNLGQTVSAATGLPCTSDPAVLPDANGSGLIYDTVGGSGPLTFDQKFSAAGDYMYQSADAQGLPEFIADDEPLENTDVVLWYTLAAHHVVRPEDWPVMPCAYTGFHLKPIGFFDGNPALDIPPTPPKACHGAHHPGLPVADRAWDS